MGECVQNSPLATTRCPPAQRTLSFHPFAWFPCLATCGYCHGFPCAPLPALCSPPPRNARLAQPPRVARASPRVECRPRGGLNPTSCSRVSLLPHLELSISPLLCRCVCTVTHAVVSDGGYERQLPHPIFGGVLAECECEESCTHRESRLCVGARAAARRRLVPSCYCPACGVHRGLFRLTRLPRSVPLSMANIFSSSVGSLRDAAPSQPPMRGALASAP